MKSYEAEVTLCNIDLNILSFNIKTETTKS